MKASRQLLLAILLVFTSVAGYAQDASQQDMDSAGFSEAELEQILAPIALYPDTVLAHILVAATYPLEVIQAERWTVDNPKLQGSDAVEAVGDRDWDPSVKALVAFPQILKRLSEDLEWTRKLGDAFLQDEEKLLASVQSLRQHAYQAGSLDDLDKVTVTHEDSAIVIEPVEREIIYVPYYDTRVVYGTWRWPYYPPVYWDYPYRDYYAGYHHEPIYWGPRIHLSFGFFFSSLHWRNHHVVRIAPRHYRPRDYYNHNQILGHQHVQRWAHDPVHRRGVAYRDIRVSDRYQRQHIQGRPSQREVIQHRNSVPAGSRQQHVNEQGSKATNRQNYPTRNVDAPEERANDARIPSPNRIRRELKDDRARVEPRNNRLSYSSQVNANRIERQGRNDSAKTTRVLNQPRPARSVSVVPKPVNAHRQPTPAVQTNRRSAAPNPPAANVNRVARSEARNSAPPSRPPAPPNAGKQTNSSPPVTKQPQANNSPPNSNRSNRENRQRRPN